MKKNSKPSSLGESIFFFQFNIFLNLPMHVLPSPSNPGMHEHWNDPSTLVHMLFGEQSWDCAVHSSISMNGKKKKKKKKKNRHWNKWWMSYFLL